MGQLVTPFSSSLHLKFQPKLTFSSHFRWTSPTNFSATIYFHPTSSSDYIRWIRAHQDPTTKLLPAKSNFRIFVLFNLVLPGSCLFLHNSLLYTIYNHFSSIIICFHHLKTIFHRLNSLKHSSNTFLCSPLHSLTCCLWFCFILHFSCF